MLLEVDLTKAKQFIKIKKNEKKNRREEILNLVQHGKILEKISSGRRRNDM